MATWQYRLRITDVWNDDDMSLEDKTAVIVQRVRAIPGFSLDALEIEDLNQILAELEDAAQANDEHWFDLVWSAFYDWADANRVWVETS